MALLLLLAAPAQCGSSRRDAVASIHLQRACRIRGGSGDQWGAQYPPPRPPGSGYGAPPQSGPGSVRGGGPPQDGGFPQYQSPLPPGSMPPSAGAPAAGGYNAASGTPMQQAGGAYPGSAPGVTSTYGDAQQPPSYGDPSAANPYGANPYGAPPQGGGYGQQGGNPYGASPYSGDPYGGGGYDFGYGSMAKQPSITDKLKGWGETAKKALGLDEESRLEARLIPIFPSCHTPIFLGISDVFPGYEDQATQGSRGGSGGGYAAEAADPGMGESVPAGA